VFKRYIQSLTYLLGRNPGFAMRYMLISMFITGGSGLPFAEDIKSWAKALAYWMYGKDLDLEQEARRYILDLADGKDGRPPKIDPDLILHGFARRGLGIPMLLDMLGSFYTGQPGRGLEAPRHVDGEPVGFGRNIPFPVFDRSRALSMGMVSPIDVGNLFTARDPSKAIAEEGQRASGAVFSVGFNLYKAIFNSHMPASDWHRWERAMPREIGAISKFFRAYTEGRERSAGGPGSGTTVANYDRNDPEQMGEMIGLAMGYQPLRAQARWDYVMAEKEAEAFLNFKRTNLMEQMFEAKSNDDDDAVERVQKSIQEYNQGLSDAERGKAITSQNLRESLQRRMKARNFREAGVPQQRGSRPLAEDIQSLYPEATIDVRRAR